MEQYPFTLSVHRLHRLLPSDLEDLRTAKSTTEGAYAILEVFSRYILALRNPTAVELDDVARISLQLNLAGLWDTIRPEFFIRYLHSQLDGDVLETLCTVLNAKPSEAKGDGGLRAGDRPSAMEAMLERMGLQKQLLLLQRM
jgi:hypothetical protein